MFLNNCSIPLMRPNIGKQVMPAIFNLFPYFRDFNTGVSPSITHFLFIQDELMSMYLAIYLCPLITCYNKKTPVRFTFDKQQITTDT